MALARVVTFDGVDPGRVAQMKRDIEGGEKPEGLPATEMIMLHDPDAQSMLAIVFFDNEEDYRQGDAFLDAMPSDGTPGTRKSVGKYTVAVRAAD